MKTAILLITRVPNMEQVEHFCAMAGPGYDVFIVADDNTKQYSAPGVQLVQADTAICESEGWKGSSPLIKPGAIAWDKAIRFAYRNDYDYVWFFEDDVLVPAADTIRTLDAKYAGVEADVLTGESNMDGPGTRWSNWHHIRQHIEMPRAHGMVCAVRLSRRLLEAVEEYRATHGTLFFIESMFHSLALHKGYTVHVIPEMIGLEWRRRWRKEEIKKDHLYHPVKNWEDQKKFRF